MKAFFRCLRPGEPKPATRSGPREVYQENTVNVDFSQQVQCAALAEPAAHALSASSFADVARPPAKLSESQLVQVVAEDGELSEPDRLSGPVPPTAHNTTAAYLSEGGKHSSITLALHRPARPASPSQRGHVEWTIANASVAESQSHDRPTNGSTPGLLPLVPSLGTSANRPPAVPGGPGSALGSGSSPTLTELGTQPHPASTQKQQSQAPMPHPAFTAQSAPFPAAHLRSTTPNLPALFGAGAAPRPPAPGSAGARAGGGGGGSGTSTSGASGAPAQSRGARDFPVVSGPSGSAATSPATQPLVGSTTAVAGLVDSRSSPSAWAVGGSRAPGTAGAGAGPAAGAGAGRGDTALLANGSTISWQLAGTGSGRRHGWAAGASAGPAALAGTATAATAAGGVGPSGAGWWSPLAGTRPQTAEEVRSCWPWACKEHKQPCGIHIRSLVLDSPSGC